MLTHRPLNTGIQRSMVDNIPDNLTLHVVLSHPKDGFSAVVKDYMNPGFFRMLARSDSSSLMQYKFKLFKAAARIIILSISDLILVKKKIVKSHINISAAGLPQKCSVYKRSTV